jgi:hypothetical protein
MIRGFGRYRHTENQKNHREKNQSPKTKTIPKAEKKAPTHFLRDILTKIRYVIGFRTPITKSTAMFVA